MATVSTRVTLHYQVPPLACDCHMHVFGDPDVYPVPVIRSYTPREASLESWHKMATPLGLERVVVVQPSAYGADNRCLIDALRQIGSSARGIAQIDALTDQTTLQDLHAVGIRGVRLNPKANGITDYAALRTLITNTADRVAPFGWHVQLYTSLSALPDLAGAISDAAVPVVLDHMGGARSDDTQVALKPLLRLLRRGKCWVKLSGAYRVSRQLSGFEDSGPVAKALVDANPEQLVWGTDWPHTASHGGAPQLNAPPIKFRDVEATVLLDRLRDATGNQSIFTQILSENPKRLYDF